MLSSHAIAQLEEARLAAAFAELADEARTIAAGGGVAARAAPGPWLNRIVAPGMLGPVSHDEIAEIVRWYESAGIEPRIEVCPYADPSLLKALASLGFSLVDFDNVLACDLSGTREIVPPSSPPPELSVRRIDPADAAEVRAYARAVVPQFFAEGAAISAEQCGATERAVRHPRSIVLGAYLDGRVVGGGGLEIAPDGSPLATLWGLAVLPEYRRRGIQGAIIAERLRIARERGARVATIGSLPGGPTERNAARFGFRVAYTRCTLVRPGPGLVSALG